MTSRRSALPHTAAHRMRLIPRQPGSWAMVLAPAIAAITLQSGFHAITMSCLVTLDWALCYGMQYAINRWIVAGARRRYAREAFICTAVTVAFGIPTLIIAPGLLRWAPWFVMTRMAYGRKWRVSSRRVRFQRRSLPPRIPQPRYRPTACTGGKCSHGGRTVPSIAPH